MTCMQDVINACVEKTLEENPNKYSHIPLIPAAGSPVSPRSSLEYKCRQEAKVECPEEAVENDWSICDYVPEGWSDTFGC